MRPALYQGNNCYLSLGKGEYIKPNGLLAIDDFPKKTWEDSYLLIKENILDYKSRAEFETVITDKCTPSSGGAIFSREVSLT